MENSPVYNQKKDYPPERSNAPEKKETNKIMWFSFGCLTSIMLIVLLFVFLIVGISVAAKTAVPATRPHTVLNLVIRGNLDEHRELHDMFRITPAPTASQIISKINKAANDPAVDGILLEPRHVMTSYSVLNEIMEALEEFRDAGKFVYAYLGMSSGRDYYLASVADQILLNPAASSGVFLGGSGIQSLYMKELLDKLGIEMTVVHSGRYKGAGENFARQTMSPELRESLTDLVDHRYEQFIADISAQRNMEPDQVRSLLEERDTLLIYGQMALQEGLIDDLTTREDLIADMKLRGVSRIVSFANYRPEQTELKHDHSIALVYLQGMIAEDPGGLFDMDSYLSSAKVQRIMTRLVEDDDVKAIVLRINTPGGSALESDIIYKTIENVKKVKPVIVSMSGSATSGGYYISAPANYIFADPYTITGSIGVAGMVPNFSNMMQSIGVNAETIYRGKYANFLNPFEAPDAQEIQALQNNLDNVYDEFLERVASGRDMSLAEVRKVAQGRMWTSQGALEAGLIDSIGTMNDAIQKAAELKELIEYNVLIYPRRRTLIEIMMERRFDFSVLKEIALSQMLPEDNMDRYLKIIRALKDDPVQFLSPVLIIDQ